MKSAKKSGQFPTIYSSTPRETTQSLPWKRDINFLLDLENNESHVKTLPAERRNYEFNIGIQNLASRNPSQGDLFAPMSFSSVLHSPKKISVVPLSKKSEREKKLTLMERISELRVILHKYNSPEEQTAIPSRMDIKKTFQCLEALNDVDSNMRDVMHLIIQTLKNSVYVNPKVLEKYTDAIMQSDDDNLKKLIKNCEQTYIPYYTMCVVLLNAFTKQDGDRIEYTKNLEEKIDELTEQVKAKEEKILDLQDKLQTAITKDIYSKIIDELKATRDRVSSFIEENRLLASQIEDLMDDNAQINKQYEEECDEVERRLAQVKQLELDKVNIKEEGEQNIRKLEEFKDLVTVVEDNLGNTVHRVQDIKKLITTLTERIDELVLENEKLNNHLSISGTEALTPRPDYRTLQDEKKVELDIFDSAGKTQIISTSVIVEELMKRLADKNQDPSASNGKPVNLTIANLNRNRNRARAGSFNVNSPLKPPKSSTLAPSDKPADNPPSSTATNSGGKSLFGRMAPKPSAFQPGNPNTISPNGKPSQFAGINTLAPSPFYDFKEKSPTESGQDYYSSRDDSSPGESSDSSPPEHKVFAGRKTDQKYALRIEIPKSKMRDDRQASDNQEKPNALINYILKTREEIENFMSNL